MAPMGNGTAGDGFVSVGVSAARVGCGLHKVFTSGGPSSTLDISQGRFDPVQSIVRLDAHLTPVPCDGTNLMIRKTCLFQISDHSGSDAVILVPR